MSTDNLPRDPNRDASGGTPGAVPVKPVTPMNLEGLLGSLEASAIARSEAARSIREIISSVESRLNALGIQMSFWVDERPLARRELSVSASSVAPYIDVQFGYGPVHGHGMHLVLREAEYVPEPTAGSGGEYALARVLKETPLASAATELQIQALDRLPDLLESIRATLDAQTETIRRARRL